MNWIKDVIGAGKLSRSPLYQAEAVFNAPLKNDLWDIVIVPPAPIAASKMLHYYEK